MPNDPLALFNQLGQVHDAAQRAGVRPELFHSLVQQESNFNPAARSPKGALGYTQLMPATAADLGVDPNDPAQNLDGGARYLKQLLDRYKGDERLALAAYNAGMGNVDKAGGIPNFPETQNYVEQVSGRAQPQSPIDLFNSLGTPAAQPAPQAPAAPAQGQAQPAGFLDNVVSSGKNLVGGLADTVLHPVQTAQNLSKVAAGGLQKIGPESLKQTFGGDYTPYADAVGQFYKDRYGGLSNIGHTLYTDPVGAAADIGAVLTMGGGAAGAAGKVLGTTNRIGRTVSTVGEVATRAGSLVDPLQLAAKGTSALGVKAAKRVIHSNVKPSDKLVFNNPTVDIPEVILRENLGPGFKGARQAKEIVSGARKQTRQMIADYDASGQPLLDTEQPFMDTLAREEAQYVGGRTPTEVTAQRSVQRARGTLKNSAWGEDVYGTQMVPTQVQVPTGAVNNAGQPVMQTQTIMQPQQVVVGRRLKPQTATEIDNFKGMVQQDNKTAYGKVDPRPEAAVRAEKALGATAKQVLEDAMPGRNGGLFGTSSPSLKSVNTRAAENIVAMKALRKMGKNEANKFPLGVMDLGALGVGAAGAAAGAPVVAVPAFLAALLKHPTTAFPIAKTVYKGSTALPTAAKALTGANQVQKTHRPVTRDEAQSAYAAYLASQQQ